MLPKRVAYLARKFVRERPSDFDLWRQCLLAELTEAAYGATLRYTKQRSSVELEMERYNAFYRALYALGRESRLFCTRFHGFTT